MATSPINAMYPAAAPSDIQDRLLGW